MTPIIAISVGLTVLAGIGGVRQEGLLKPRPGPLSVHGAPAPTPFPSSFDTAPRRTNPQFAPFQAPATIHSPKPPAAPQGQLFKPYKPTSVYSPRGGLDSYPAPKKPRTYIDLR